jgi:hypothetical protein
MKAFKAANEKNSKILSNALDISGVVGTTCKHGIPMKFLNIKTGERYLFLNKYYIINYCYIIKLLLLLLD